jgi:hypothetical protein
LDVRIAVAEQLTSTYRYGFVWNRTKKWRRPEIERAQDSVRPDALGLPVRLAEQRQHAVAEELDAAGGRQPLRRPEIDSLRAGVE